MWPPGVQVPGLSYPWRPNPWRLATWHTASRHPAPWRLTMSCVIRLWEGQMIGFVKLSRSVVLGKMLCFHICGLNAGLWLQTLGRSLLVVFPPTEGELGKVCGPQMRYCRRIAPTAVVAFLQFVVFGVEGSFSVMATGVGVEHCC